MKRKALWSILLVFMLGVIVVHPALADDGRQELLEKVREVNAKYHSIPAANAAGYNLVPGLDYCFNSPGTGGMGFHLINVALLDTTIEPLKPEAFVYAPQPSGRLELAAVEYIVPISAWDTSHAQPPSLFGRTYERNLTLGVYTLHAWLFMHNPLGMFNDWNPRVSCP